jgi:Wzt C-terminal domain
VSSILTGGAVELTARYECDHPVDDAVLAVEIRNIRGETMFAATSDTLGSPLGRLDGTGRLTIRFDGVPLLDGTYPVSIQLRHRHDGNMLALREGLDQFEVMSDARVEGQVNVPVTMSMENGSRP